MSKSHAAIREQRQRPRPKGARRKKPVTVNPNLSTQTRKLLTKHYRAKYGVR